MASLSLPRVLHPRKTSLEIERENFEKSQTISLHKAINNVEAPVKEKHVRSAIIGTYHTQGAKLYWSIVLRLPAMDDRIVAWKLCHVSHKVLREGHPLCLVHSQRHVNDLDEVGKLWRHLTDGYGAMIRKYTLLLMTKLDFHRKNPRFPGHLGVTPEELDSIGGSDINNYFQMTVEMFDYLEAILELQAAVFGSLNMARSNSMTTAGQCRLAPLIPCIQDASKLYDYCVKIMFKLHASLQPDILLGHRERFLKQFKQLKQFYQNTSNLQYFKDLIAIPPLPENPPNFLITSTFGDYVTQEVVVPEPEPEDDLPTEGNLIDTTDASEPVETVNHHLSLMQHAHQELIKENELLKRERDRVNIEFERVIALEKRKLAMLENKLLNLETDLAKKDSELTQERQVKEDLLSSFAELQNHDSEQKNIVDKFNRLKNWYTKLRNEHIAKLNDYSELQKQCKVTVSKLETAEHTKEELENRIKTLEEQVKEVQEKESEVLKTQSVELENLKKDKELFNMETEILRKSVEDALKERDSARLELDNLTKEKDELKHKSEEFQYKILEADKQAELLKKETDEKLKEIVSKSLINSQEILTHAIDEVDNPALTALTCTPDYLKSLKNDCVGALQTTVQLSFEDYSSVIVAANVIAHRLANFIVQGRATCNTSPDINFGEKMADTCKQLGELIVNVIKKMKVAQSTQEEVNLAIQKLEEVSALAENINVSLLGEKAENLADMLESEMSAMDKAIEEAAKAIQEMLNNSRAADSGIKLEVNEKILDSCTGLMHAIRILVQKSKLLQSEIVAQGRGTASAKEFYKRNSQWTDGFISAAKAVAVAAKFLLTAADKAVTSNGKLEQLVVASQEISASTAQLVVASRVKADRKSVNLKQLTQASKEVTTATGSVVATVKDCSQLIDEAEELDVSNLTLHQAKRLEMDSRVRVLELEKELEMERLRLAALRRHHYQLAGDGA
ncbi:huntingtin-interacting protein 1 isoform X2 [Aethina tumida]|uniref:huntingtin-interacting protein 1 isoform X2 n=1 Tax=Aethina tumida TaxID=116153 RepID=UPI00096B59D2|nr:huntingtin-interacting protein 1 isoform X2 [Aethina tumida]